MSWFSKRGLLVIAAIALFIPVLAACNGDDGIGDDVTDDEAADTTNDVTDDTDDAIVDETDDDEDDADVDDAAVELDGEVALGFIEGWDEGVSSSYLWGAILENHGMTVNFEPMADAGILYQAVADQDIDLFVSAALPLTHESYWDANEDDLEYIGTWYEELLLAFSVPQHIADEHGIESLEDLADNADLFDSTITGIEPGAGMMGIAMEDVMPAYGLDDWELLESSTAAMLTEWETAYDAGEPIVATLWEPHWAYAEWDIHNLEDPEGAWGELDQQQVVGWAGFSDEFPEVANWLSNFTLESDEIGELMDYVTVQAEDGEQLEYAQMWLDDGGQEIVDEWLN